MSWPADLKIDAFTRAPVRDAALPASARKWSAGRIGAPEGKLLPRPPADLSDWRHPDVGWGLLLPDDDTLGVDARARGDDAPEPLRRLLAARAPAPVLRYRADREPDTLRRYDVGQRPQDPSVSAGSWGTGRGRIPRYLLIHGGPRRIPWEVQYDLGQYLFVGRLPLEGDALANYVDRLLVDWDGAGANPLSAVVWAADHGGDDITVLMRTSIAAKVHAALAGDPDIAADYADGSAGRGSTGDLAGALRGAKPGLVVTTSHGMTAPLDSAGELRRLLGRLVGSGGDVLDVEGLVHDWAPDGAIWYAHACCSAGSGPAGVYDGLVTPGGDIDTVLRALAALEGEVAPLALALLGAEKPARAFIGHVEPTFDWTLRHRQTGQILTTPIVDALYTRLYRKQPVGRAIGPVLTQGSSLLALHDAALREYTRTGKGLEDAAAFRLMAYDRRSFVVLGDPTVALPLH